MFHEGKIGTKMRMVIDSVGIEKEGYPIYQMHLKQEWDQNPNKKGQEMNNQLNDIRMEAKAEGMTIKKGGVYYGSRGWTLMNSNCPFRFRFS